MKCSKPFLQGLTLLNILQRKTNNGFIITLEQVFPERGEGSKAALGESVQAFYDTWYSIWKYRTDYTKNRLQTEMRGQRDVDVWIVAAVWPTVYDVPVHLKPGGELWLNEQTSAFLQACPVALTRAEMQIDKLWVSMFCAGCALCPFPPAQQEAGCPRCNRLWGTDKKGTHVYHPRTHIDALRKRAGWRHDREDSSVRSG